MPAPSRRVVLAGGTLALAVLAAPAARAQSTPAAETVTANVLDAMAASFAVSAKLTADAISSVRALVPARFQPAERARVAGDIQELSDELSALAIRQQIVLGDIADYIRLVRASGYDPDAHGKLWRFLVGEMRDVAAQVRVIQQMQTRASWLSSTLSPSEDMELSRLMEARAGLLTRLSAMPPPQSSAELDKLAAMHARYTDLARQLYDLRRELSEARARFA